ncbi:MAG: hypothetical protein PGN13_16020 [Patulibacter minatonensis]
MSRRVDRATYPDSVRRDLVEDDLDEHEGRLDALEERSDARRAGMWANLTTIVVGVLVLAGTIFAAVLK